MRLLSQVISSSCCERNWSTYGNFYSVKKSKLKQSRAETMVHVHTNLCLIYKQSNRKLKGKTKMWDVFLDDMGLDNSVELALANLDLNEPVLEPIIFDDGDTVEGSSSTPVDAEKLWIQRRRMKQMKAVVTMMMSTVILILMMSIDDS